MVGCNSYRQPSLLAKITSTVDVISGGRLDWGIGAGWYENEYRGYGYEFPAAKDRIGMLRETVEIVRSMWTNPETTYDGQHYQLRRANCDPKPVQTPHPPIWIGGGGEQLTLRVVARLRRLLQLRRQARRVRPQVRDPEGPLRLGRPGLRRDPQDVVTRGVRAGDRGGGGGGGHPQPVGRAGRELAQRQPGRHPRAGGREDPDVRRPRLHRLHPLVRRLPGHESLELLATKVMPEFR